VRDVIKRAKHPYTQGLMGAIPSLGADKDKLAQIDGAMPRLDAVPAGCAFHPRCPRAIERCSRDRPELEASGTTRAACWLADVPVELAAS
jgi:peptide/nickel transport system ATP-binding protein